MGSCCVASFVYCSVLILSVWWCSCCLFFLGVVLYLLVSVVDDVIYNICCLGMYLYALVLKLVHFTCCGHGSHCYGFVSVLLLL